jgi:hypothetical protein
VDHYVQRIYAISLSDGTNVVAPFLIGDTTGANSNNTPVYVYGSGDGSVTDPYNSTGNPVVQFNALRRATPWCNSTRCARTSEWRCPW